MKLKILTFLFLLVAFCPVSIFGQEKNELVAETIELNNIKISASKKAAFISAFLKPLLSKNGSVEFNEQSQTLFLKDTQSRVIFIKKLASILDNSGLQARDFFAKSSKDKKRITETVHVQIMALHPRCDVGEEFVYDESDLKRNLLIKTMEAVKIQFKVVQMGIFADGLELTGNRKLVELAKKIITLFDGTDLDRISNS